jgi:hypothetical protein
LDIPSRPIPSQRWRHPSSGGECRGWPDDGELVPDSSSLAAGTGLFSLPHGDEFIGFSAFFHEGDLLLQLKNLF